MTVQTYSHLVLLISVIISKRIFVIRNWWKTGKQGDRCSVSVMELKQQTCPLVPNFKIELESGLLAKLLHYLGKFLRIEISEED